MHSPRAPHGKPPPRSGKSIFLRQGAKPMVQPSARVAQVVKPEIERIVKGQAISTGSQKLVPKVHQAPQIQVRQLHHKPTGAITPHAYPRAGSIHSLQYRNIVERAGAHQAPHPGRGSIWAPSAADSRPVTPVRMRSVPTPAPAMSQSLSAPTVSAPRVCTPRVLPPSSGVTSPAPPPPPVATATLVRTEKVPASVPVRANTVSQLTVQASVAPAPVSRLSLQTVPAVPLVASPSTPAPLMALSGGSVILPSSGGSVVLATPVEATPRRTVTWVAPQETTYTVSPSSVEVPAALPRTSCFGAAGPKSFAMKVVENEAAHPSRNPAEYGPVASITPRKTRSASVTLEAPRASTVSSCHRGTLRTSIASTVNGDMARASIVSASPLAVVC